jgi:hypothetical protein
LKNRWLAALLLLIVASASPVFAQGGAGSTGSIQGEVTDESGGVLPGVTVTVSGASMIGSRTDTTNAQGVYRFLGLPAGTYTVKFEIGGFAPQTKSDIRIGIGFTASVGAKLSVKAMTDEVTVTGEAAPIDKTSTRTQVNFDQKQLDALPNARDMWSLLSTAPGVELNRFDVGGSTAGTQTTYVAYGNGGQNRPLIEGINTTEGTSAAGFYFDYGSFGEVIVGAAGNTAEMPSGGVLTNFVGKSGGNQLSGEVYYEYENADIQASNISADQLLRGYGNLPSNIITALGLDRASTNTLVSYKNLNASVGGPIIKDKLWGWGGLLRQDLVSYQPSAGAILDGTQFVNKLINYTGKLTYQLTQKDRFQAYVQYGIKRQPYRTDAVVGGPQHVTSKSTVAQDSPSWVGKIEYNRTIGNRSYFEVRAGEFGYNFGLVNHDQTGARIEDQASLRVVGGGRDWLSQRRRKQTSGAFTTFVDDVAGGNHQIKVGGEIQHETGRTVWKQYYTNNVVMLTRNGVAELVRLGSPVDSISGLRNYGLFVNDTFTRNRLSLNIGLRFDRYRAFLPAQERKASTFFTALTVAENPNVIDFNHIVPRLGFIYDIQGNGKTLFKANYGKYYFNPGVNLADASNPNSATQYNQYAWTDTNRDGLWQNGEQGALQSSVGGSANTTIDPNLKNSVTNEFSTWLERELGGNIAAKIGLVWKMDRDGYQTENPNRPKSAWNIGSTVTDNGPDGRAGTADDRTGIAAFALNSSVGSAAPAYVFNPAGYEADYKTVELALNKRFSKKWSMVASFTNTWTSEFGTSYFGTGSGGNYGASGTLFGGFAGATGFPITPNGKTEKSEFTQWNFKIFGTVEPGWGLRVTPVFKMQQGYPYGRVFTASPAGTGATAVIQNFLAESLTAHRMETATQFDIRADKNFKLRGRVTLSVLADVFNVLNANTELNIRATTGTVAISQTGVVIPAFQTPLTILPPRIARLSARLSW